MPRLSDVVDDPKALEESITRIMSDGYARNPPKLNTGFKSLAEARDWICQPPAAGVDFAEVANMTQGGDK